MHGIIHQSLKEYVVENGGETTWEQLRDEADLEPKLYLPVSHYPDEEFDDAIETLAELSGHDRAVVERNVGRHLAPTLLDTFTAYVQRHDSAVGLLASFDQIAAELEEGTDEPPFSGTDEAGGATVTCREGYGYCGLLAGLLEGIVEAYDDGGTVTELGCVDDGDEACSFRVEPVQGP